MTVGANPAGINSTISRPQIPKQRAAPPDLGAIPKHL